MAKVTVRKGMPSVQLDKEEFKKRFLKRFYDPVFEPLTRELDRIADAAWISYSDYHKAPRTRKAGPGFADPNYEISIEWLEARSNIQAAERRQKSADSPSRVLIVNGSSRNDKTFPGEILKRWGLGDLARC